MAPVTRTVRGIPVEVALGPEQGLPAPCAANLDAIVTIPMGRLDSRIAELDPTKLTEVAAAIRFAPALDR